MRPSGAVRTSQTPQLGSASPSVICGCCPHPRAPGALALSLDRERDLEMDTETEPKQSQTHLSDSHFISLAASAGCDTIRCHTTAWNASVCGVTVLGLTVGTMTQASATLAVNPPSRPTIP